MNCFTADTHVHLYDFFDLEKLINAAFCNLNVTKDNFGILYLTLSSKEERNLKEIASRLSKYRFNSLEHDGFIEIKDKDRRLFVVSGFQIITSEKIEVLNLASSIVVSDGMSIEETLREVTNSGGKPVLPWSPGKWMGKRGKIISRFIKSHSPGDILFSKLGVISFQSLALNGSDPLPMDGEESLVGSYGIKGEIDSTFALNLAGFKNLLEGNFRRHGAPLPFLSAIIRYLRFCLVSRKPI